MTGGWHIRRNVKPQTVEIVHSLFPFQRIFRILNKPLYSSLRRSAQEDARERRLDGDFPALWVSIMV